MTNGVTPADNQYDQSRESAYIRCKGRLAMGEDFCTVVSQYRAELHAAWIEWLYS